VQARNWRFTERWIRGLGAKCSAAERGGDGAARHPYLCNGRPEPACVFRALRCSVGGIRIMKRIIFIALFGFIICASPCVRSETKGEFKRSEDVIYGRKSGTALTLDVFQPDKTNGYGILFMVSGGWFSAHEAVNANFYKAFLDRGYTVFAVVHGSQPKFTITEIVPDIHRAVRFVRHNAAKYGIDPNRIGISGASAGGHLSLTMGTQGRTGRDDAKDPIDRENSAVQAVACFFPPTDFLNYGKPGEDAVGVGILKDYKAAFGPRSDTADERQKLGKEISPVYFITSNMPPTLIIHGDADKLVPIQQAESFVSRAREAGATAKLVVKEGKAHGWGKIEEDIPLLADWFDQYLRGIKSQ
jgi:acetyl esterase/lipase